MTTGVGPEVSYAYQIGHADLAAEVKWSPEIGTSNRLNGDTVWFKFAISWGTRPARPVQAT